MGPAFRDRTGVYAIFSAQKHRNLLQIWGGSLPRQTTQKNKDRWRTSTEEFQNPLELRGLAVILYIAAIVSQNSFVRLLLGYRASIARYVAEWGIALICLCRTKHKGGYSTPLGECWAGRESVS